jgi:uncharacterized membrane protein YoaK (UPF0700 family)
MADAPSVEATKPATPPMELRSPTATAALLAFTAGYVDTCGFVALFGLFTAHVTGNFVLIGASLADLRPGVIGKLLALPMFIIVVAVTHWFVNRRSARATRSDGAVLIAQALLLLAFMWLGIMASPIVDPDSLPSITVGFFAVAAMAVQNVASRSVFAALSPTTVMTGNVTQVVMDLVDLATKQGDGPGVQKRLYKMWPPVVAFAVGAVGGGLCFLGVGFWALIVPIGATMTVLFLQRRAPSPA